MIRISLTALVLTLAAPAVADTTWSGTGPRGGTIEGSGSCASGQGSVTCSKSSRYTNPAGQVWTNEATRLRTRDGVSVNGRVTGPGGRVTDYSRKRSH